MKQHIAALIALSLLVSACGKPLPPAPTVIPTTQPPPTATLAPSATPTLVPTATSTPTPLPSKTPRPTPTRTPTAAASPGALYLSQDLGSEKGEAIIPAPEIQGLTLRLVSQKNPAGESTVEYLDGNGKVVLIAGAQQLDYREDEADLLGDILYNLYGGESLYSKASTYPRFHFPISGVKAAFFGLDQTLTRAQILRMKEALELFTRPALEPIQVDIFDEQISYIIFERLEDEFIGANLIGTGMVLLDRQYLFGDKYLLANVLAHEGSHVLQGGMTEGFGCKDLLRREVGDQTIPPAFETWLGDRVMMGVANGTLGAYHVSYWVLAKLGFDNLGFLRQVIQTGNAAGEPLVRCKDQ